MRYYQLLIETRLQNEEELKEIIDSYSALKPLYKKIRKLIIKTPQLLYSPDPADFKNEYDEQDYEQGTLKRFVADYVKNSVLSHVNDWLRDNSTIINTKEERYEQAKGAQRLSQLWRMADDYFVLKNKKASEEEGNINIIMKFPNGFKWVELTSEQALAREGKLMGHCVGTYCEEIYHGRYQVLSLRDSKNQPHVTVGLDVEDGDKALDQIQGKGNSNPDKKYIPYIKKFLIKLYSLSVSIAEEDLLPLNLIKIDGELYEVDNLPENLVIKQIYLDLSKYKIFKLPDNLTIKGSLILSGNNYLTKLPENLKIIENLYIERTRITHLPKSIQVGQSVDATNSALKEFNIKKVNGSLMLSGTNIKTLPNNLHVEDNLFLSRTDIKRLPENLYVGNDLDVSNEKMTELPDNMYVGGRTSLVWTNVKKLPKNSFFGGRIVGEFSSLKKIPKSTTVNGEITWV